MAVVAWQSSGSSGSSPLSSQLPKCPELVGPRRPAAETPPAILRQTPATNFTCHRLGELVAIYLSATCNPTCQPLAILLVSHLQSYLSATCNPTCQPLAILLVSHLQSYLSATCNPTCQPLAILLVSHLQSYLSATCNPTCQPLAILLVSHLQSYLSATCNPTCQPPARVWLVRHLYWYPINLSHPS